MCGVEKNAVLMILNHVLACIGTTWWRNTKEFNMKAGLGDFKIWKHKWEGGITVAVSGQICLGMSRRRRVELKKKEEVEWKKQWDLLSFSLHYVKHSVAHTTNIDDVTKTNETQKERRMMGSLGSTIPLRSEGSTEQMCADTSVVDKWINGYYAVTQKFV